MEIKTSETLTAMLTEAGGWSFESSDIPTLEGLSEDVDRMIGVAVNDLDGNDLSDGMGWAMLWAVDVARHGFDLWEVRLPELTYWIAGKDEEEVISAIKEALGVQHDEE